MPESVRVWCSYLLGRVLLFLMALATLVFWLPFGRSLVEGDAYEWGLFGLGGAGLNRYFWLPVVGVVVSLVLRWMGNCRGRTQAMSAVAGFFGLLALVTAVFAMTHPEALVVRGDTLGLRLSLRWIGPLVFGGATILTIWWAQSLDEDPNWPGWHLRQKVWLAGIVLLIVASTGFLLAGEQHGQSDGYGVRALALAWLCVDGILAPAVPAVRPVA